MKRSDSFSRARTRPALAKVEVLLIVAPRHLQRRYRRSAPELRVAAPALRLEVTHQHTEHIVVVFAQGPEDQVKDDPDQGVENVARQDEDEARDDDVDA